jgi:hypothetical protein
MSGLLKKRYRARGVGVLRRKKLNENLKEREK